MAMEEDSQLNKRKRKRRLVWTIPAEKYLLDLWSKHIDSLRGSKKNVIIYMEMSEECKKENFNFTAKEEQWKLSNLTNKYRSEIKNIGSSGEQSTWVHFNKVQSILGSGGVNVESVMLESADTSTFADGMQFKTAAASSICFKDGSDVESSEVFSLPPLSRSSTNSPAKKPMSKHDFQEQLLNELRIANQITERAVKVNEERNKIMREMVENNNDYYKKMLYLKKIKMKK